MLPERNIDVTTAVQSVALSQQQEDQRYAIDGRTLKTATKGLNIIRMTDGTVRKHIVK